jgi:hypothetical protein
LFEKIQEYQRGTNNQNPRGENAMGKRKTKIVDGFEIDNPPKEITGDAASAVLERRKHGSKSDRLDWLRLVQAHRIGEDIPPTIAEEVFQSSGFEGDSWSALHRDAKDLAQYMRSKKAPDQVGDFLKKYGEMETLTKQAEAIKENLKGVEKLIQELRTLKSIEQARRGPALSAFNQNKRLFPDRNESLLQEAGIT